MKARRWPDVVIAAAIVALTAFGAWALWGEELGLRGEAQPPAPTRAGPGGHTT
jgi:hypothetical protein